MSRRQVWDFIILASFVIFGISSLAAVAEPRKNAVSESQSLSYDVDSYLDINSLLMFVYNDGNFAYDNANIMGKTDGLYYPRGTGKTVIYSAGIWVGAKVGNQIRVALSEYNSEFVPGPMQNATYQPDIPEFRVYKLNKSDNASSNPDFGVWPVDQGAPMGTNGRPLVLGDQMTWSVFNDADPSAHDVGAGSTAPLGIEIQQSTFGYGSSGPLGSAYFIKYRIINKGANLLESTYVSIWADPDLGNSSDDLVGCDTMVSLGYCYNSGVDAVYGANAPAVGFDFFQGPIVPGESYDTAYVNGVPRPGYRSLGMTSFNKYINGTDPAIAWETYGYMRGLVKDPISGDMVPMINPTTGDATQYAVSGDPVAGMGWVDAAAADRRFMLSSGPFTMAPGDTQEVVAAVLVAQGNSSLNSVAALKQADLQVQSTFYSDFNIPSAAPIAEVYGRGLDQAADVFWSGELIGDVQANPTLGESFVFEGFNVYQGLTANGPWKKIATYDEIDEIELIYDDVYNPVTGGYERIIVQSGQNTGIKLHHAVNSDAFTSLPIENGTEYFFSVTGYYYDQLHLTEFYDLWGNFLGYLSPVIESPKVTVSVVPTATHGVVSDTALHIAGNSEGMVIVEWIDESQMTGHDYRVTFNWDRTWSLIDLNTSATILSNQSNQSGDYNYPVIDGFMPRVISPEPGVSGYSWLGTRWMTGHDWGGRYFFGGLDNGERFFGSNVTVDQYVPVEIRFSWISTQKAYLYTRGGLPSYSYTGYFDVPFTVWDTSVNPNRQLNACFVENQLSQCRDSTWLPCDETGASDREYLMIFASTYNPNPQSFYTSKILINDAPQMDILYSIWPRVRPGHDPASELEDGQVMTINAAKPNFVGDMFQFSAGYRCGDANRDHRIDVGDAVFLINYIFAGGVAPTDFADADVDCNGRINIADCVLMINFIFAGGAVPCTNCGL